MRSELLKSTSDAAIEFLESLPGRPVGRPVDWPGLVAGFGDRLPESGEDAKKVVDGLIAAAGPGLVATPGPRYFGFVIGGTVDAALAAEWMASAWDQNAFSYVSSPAAAAAEEVARRWVLDLLGLPSEMSAGFTTGATMANFTALAAARHAALRKVGWDVEEQGLFGAPAVTVVTSDESHVSIFAALQMLGLGRGRVLRVAADEQGRMRADELKAMLKAIDTPMIVCAQAGNVNTGSFDPIDEIADAVKESGGWLHVDGAFGLWAAASQKYRPLVRGIHRADSIALDSHKWLNVPYDSGLALVRDRAAHHAAMTLNAPYYATGPETARENHNWVAEASRRARGFAVYAALRSMGRKGAAELVERCCGLAQRMAAHLLKGPGVRILNEVALNQVLVQFGDDDHTREVIRRVHEEGTCWAGGTSWHGMHLMRISISNWSTTEQDIDVSAEAILGCSAATRAQSRTPR